MQGSLPWPAGYDLRQLGQLPVNTWKEYIRNDFEATVFQKHPSLTLLKQQLYERGAEFVSMSGSGSAIYGLFKEKTWKSTWIFPIVVCGKERL